MINRTLNEHLKKYAALAAAEKAAKAALENEKQIIINELNARGVNVYAGAGHAVRYQIVDQARLNTNELKKAAPDIYAAFTTVTSAARFNFK